MEMQALSFQTHNWEAVEKTEHKGETGFAFWQTLHANNVRVRKVEYSAGYKADHWCSKGHIILCVEGEMITELDNGRFFTLTAGMTYFVGDNCEQHRSSSEKGCKLFIVD
jgi:quercetin dioxygenase-like cupin family protein